MLSPGGASIRCVENGRIKAYNPGVFRVNAVNTKEIVSGYELKRRICRRFFVNSFELIASGNSGIIIAE